MEWWHHLEHGYINRGKKEQANEQIEITEEGLQTAGVGELASKSKGRQPQILLIYRHYTSSAFPLIWNSGKTLINVSVFKSPVCTHMRNMNIYYYFTATPNTFGNQLQLQVNSIDMAHMSFTYWVKLYWHVHTWVFLIEPFSF